MNQQRYFAYRSLLADLDEWRSADALEDQTYQDPCNAAEGLLLSRAGELGEQNASWLLDALLACGPRVAMSGEAA